MGGGEWVPLAGIVLSRSMRILSKWRLFVDRYVLLTRQTDHAPSPTRSICPDLLCAALATGMKCLPHAKLPEAKGNVLHDWHAEILSVRALNRWLLDECAALARSKHIPSAEASPWVRWRGSETPSGMDSLESPSSDSRQTPRGADGHEMDATGDSASHVPPFALRDDVAIHMYCSAAPCGDASMELTMSSQPDATPWTTQPAADEMLGRGNFDRLGVVRRKPARPDAPLTLSKSCSDKLALKQCTGLLSGMASLLLWPGDVYLQSVVLPEAEYVEQAVRRAFGADGRMRWCRGGCRRVGRRVCLQAVRGSDDEQSV